MVMIWMTVTDLDDRNKHMKCSRIICDDLQAACQVLEDNLIDYDLDDGNRIMSECMDEVIDALNENDFDFNCV